MCLQKKQILALDKLSLFLREIDEEKSIYVPLFELINQAKIKNGWFTKENVLMALKSWGKILNKESIQKWISPYNFEGEKEIKTVGLILAGNIPLVGLHDIISVLLSGHHSLVKVSSSDALLIPYLIKKLSEYDASFEKNITFTSERFTTLDAVIATGSNNSARYFEYYFSKVPNLIRKNRNSIAVLDGNETKEQLQELAQDIVQYYGLGCRNISKIMIPKGYDLNLIFEALYPHKEIINSSKYANNYDYNKAIFLMNLVEFLDNGFFLLREHSDYTSPVSCLHYEYYSDLEQVKLKLKEDSDKIQCISSNKLVTPSVSLGKTQTPALWDYADRIDTLSFLSQL